MDFGLGNPYYSYTPGPDYLGLAMVLGLVALIGLLRFVTKDKDGNVPKTKIPLKDWPLKFLWTYKLRVAAALVTFFLAGTGAALVVAVLIAADVKFSFNANSHKKQQAAEKAESSSWLAKLGPNHAARAEKIERMFAERVETISGFYSAKWQSRDSDTSRWYECSMAISVQRSLAAMDNREREYLRIVELLNSAANGLDRRYLYWKIALLDAEGKGKAEHQGLWFRGDDVRQIQNPIEVFRQRVELKVDPTITMINEELNRLSKETAVSPELRAVAAESFERISQGASGWLVSTKVKGTVFEPQSPHALKIGTMQDGVELSYSGEGSMLTVAPPGSGKTQCNVFPNLLTWKGPAVVLDISGDIYENTSRWRAENVGPVYKFSPLEPDSSHCYNPLAFVRREADYIWEDSRLLAEMMIVPSNASDPFWENEARNVLTAAIAYVCYSNPSDKRPMHEVLDIMFGGEPFKNMITGLKMAIDVRVMQQNANALEGMNEKTLSSVLQTARSSLSAWTGERIARATKRSDWNPADLRNGSNPTIYIYIRPNEVESYLSLLRVFIGQHIRVLTGGAVPARGSAPILFMLDELPRLRNMPPVDEALNIGRKYGLRLWMFAQSVGQLKEAYKNADGMISSCAVRIYMNPSGADGLAEKLSEEIGNIDSLADGTRKRMVEAADLAGPAFRDHMVVFGLNARPAKVRKDFAWKDEKLKSRMGAMEFEATK